MVNKPSKSNETSLKKIIKCTGLIISEKTTIKKGYHKISGMLVSKGNWNNGNEELKIGRAHV